MQGLGSPRRSNLVLDLRDQNLGQHDACDLVGEEGGYLHAFNGLSNRTFGGVFKY